MFRASFFLSSTRVLGFGVGGLVAGYLCIYGTRMGKRIGRSV